MDGHPLMITDRPWAEMEEKGIATPSLYQYFKNIFPGHVINGLDGKGIENSDLQWKTGKFNYVVLKDDVIALCRLDPNHDFGGHIDLADKEVILAGGELKVFQGRIKEINNSSGHYLPQGPSAKLSAIRAFRKIGFDITDTYVERFWNGKAWVKV